jgi:phenylalanyl-tRNA synthetase beta subunit
MQRQKEGTIGASQRAQQRKERIRTLLLEGKYSEAITTALDSPAVRSPIARLCACRVCVCARTRVRCMV